MLNFFFSSCVFSFYVSSYTEPVNKPMLFFLSWDSSWTSSWMLILWISIIKAGVPLNVNTAFLKGSPKLFRIKYLQYFLAVARIQHHNLLRYILVYYYCNNYYCVFLFYLLFSYKPLYLNFFFVSKMKFKGSSCETEHLTVAGTFIDILPLLWNNSYKQIF